MKTLITQVGTFTTGDAVADAVVQYWLALTEERRADLVEIPIVGSNGAPSHVQLTLGPSLPLAVVDADQVRGFDDDDAADLVLAQLRSLSLSVSAPFGPGDLPDLPNGYDNSFL